jgi:fibronectin type 3 domain-containing protein
MTYHDTPAQPLSEMRYRDTTAATGEKHSYAVVTINSVGLKSAPSATVALKN